MSTHKLVAFASSIIYMADAIPFKASCIVPFGGIAGDELLGTATFDETDSFASLDTDMYPIFIQYCHDNAGVVGMNSFRIVYGNDTVSSVAGAWNGPAQQTGWTCSNLAVTQRTLNQLLIYYTDSHVEALRGFWATDTANVTTVTLIGVETSIGGDEVLAPLTFSETEVFYGFTGTSDDIQITSL